MRFIRKLIFLLVGVVLLASFTKFVSAEAVTTPVSTPPSEVSSFEIFWPIVAGRTMGDSLYFLKSLKEGLRGVLIFGQAQKADYSVFLTTKRIVEIEKLILEGKADLVEKTLVEATKQIDKATVNVTQALAKGNPFQEQAVNMGNRLSSLEIFISQLILKTDKNKDGLSKILEKISLLKVKLL
ncbi:MAG: DUF5667 domain-containing protein [Patescibacteria group bacterium]